MKPPLVNGLRSVEIGVPDVALTPGQFLKEVKS